MKQVLDTSHHPIIGLFRSPDGGLVVKNDKALQLKVAERDRVVRIQNQVDALNKEVSDLRQMFQQLIDKNGNTS
jgi:hypothetical protein